MEEEHGVKIDANYRLGRIKLYGLPEDILDVQTKIYDMINKLSKNYQLERDAEYFSRSVRWHYVDKISGTPIEYDPKMNMTLEKKYRAQESRLSIEFGYESLTIDYRDMTVSSDSGTRHKLLRLPVGNGEISFHNSYFNHTLYDSKQ